VVPGPRPGHYTDEKYSANVSVIPHGLVQSLPSYLLKSLVNFESLLLFTKFQNVRGLSVIWFSVCDINRHYKLSLPVFSIVCVALDWYCHRLSF